MMFIFCCFAKIRENISKRYEEEEWDPLERNPILQEHNDKKNKKLIRRIVHT